MGITDNSDSLLRCTQNNVFEPADFQFLHNPVVYGGVLPIVAGEHNFGSQD